MKTGHLLCTCLLLLGGCFQGQVYHAPMAAPGGAAYYQSASYAPPYLPGSPVFGSPYRGGPVRGGIYASGDGDDRYGGPVFSPFHGVVCDRRPRQCLNRDGGANGQWTQRFFGRRAVAF